MISKSPSNISTYKSLASPVNFLPQLLNVKKEDVPATEREPQTSPKRYLKSIEASLPTARYASGRFLDEIRSKEIRSVLQQQPVVSSPDHHLSIVDPVRPSALRSRSVNKKVAPLNRQPSSELEIIRWSHFVNDQH